MKEIKVGEYVRTRAGKIAKCIGYNKEMELYRFDKGVKWHYAYYTDIFDKDEFNEFINEDIVKHSEQLIDLMEVGDIIKYKIENMPLETRGYLEGITDISDKEMLQNIRNDKDYKVLEILTKELYEANGYKVGGEDE